MITVHLKLFASMKDLCGFSEKEISYDHSISISRLIDDLTESHPEIAGRRKSLLIALNEEYTEQGTLLADGDVVAIFPPVSGG